MSRKDNSKIYEEIMLSVSKTVKNALNEAFEAPEKSWKEKMLPGGDKKYAQRCIEAENEYYKNQAKFFIKELKSATGMQDLLNISKKMMAEGFKFPVSGMLVSGAMPANASLRDIIWRTYDLDSSLRASDLAKIESKTGVNDVVVYTYTTSWRWWVANIIRCLIFWNEPYGSKANEGINELMAKYAPECPIKKVYPSYFE